MERHVGEEEDPAIRAREIWSGDKLKDSVEEPTTGLVNGVGGMVDSIGMQEENQKIIAKLTRHIIPLLWSINLFSYLLRMCLINMHVVLTTDLNISEYQYGGALGAFYLGFVVFPMPANLILERVKMNMWISLLVFVWGCITMLSVFATNATALIACRFCLGIAEAGLSPGVVYYITTWFGEKYRVRQLSLLQSAIPCALATGGFLSSLVLEHMDGVLGMRGWRWLYLIAGAPTIVLSVVFYFCLPNTPNEASFLTQREREVLVYSRAMAANVWLTSTNRTSRPLFWSTVTNSKNWMLAFCGMTAMGTMTGVNGFVPAILYEAGATLVMSNRLIVIPAVLTIFALLFWAKHSSKRKERFWPTFIAMFVALVTLGACTAFVFLIDLALVVALLCVYESAMFSGYSILLSVMVNSVLGSTSIGIGLYYSVAGFGGWFGPFLMGFFRDLTGDNVVGLAVMCSSLAISIGLFSVIHINQRSTQLEVGSPLRFQHDTSTAQSEGTNNEFKGEGEGGAAILV